LELSLSQLISSIGESVQEARYALEERSVELYFGGGYKEDGERLIPITKNISLPTVLNGKSGSRELNIPLTALFSHKTMSLNKVDVNMRLLPCGQGSEMLFRMAGDTADGGDQSGQYVDLALSFGLDDTPEGMARLNQENVKLM